MRCGFVAAKTMRNRARSRSVASSERISPCGSIAITIAGSGSRWVLIRYVIACSIQLMVADRDRVTPLTLPRVCDDQGPEPPHSDDKVSTTGAAHGRRACRASTTSTCARKAWTVLCAAPGGSRRTRGGGRERRFGLGWRRTIVIPWHDFLHIHELSLNECQDRHISREASVFTVSSDGAAAVRRLLA